MLTHWKVIVLALAIGIGGYMVPGLYADWVFLRAARTQQSLQNAQRIISEQKAELDKLKAAQALAVPSASESVTEPKE